jgi:hypothetical protein
MPIDITVDVQGAKLIARALKQAANLSPKAMGAGLYAAGNDIMRLSKRLVPVDLGTLKGSGYVTLPDTSGDSAEIEVGYGGPAASYAVEQHERTEFSHPVGQAKYLQDAVDQTLRSLPAKIAAVSNRAFQEGRGAKRDPGTPTDPNESAVVAVASFLGSFGGT